MITNKRKSYISAFIFLCLFIAPQTLLSVLPEQLQKTYLYSIFGGYILCFIYLIKDIFNTKNILLVLLTSCFIILGLLNLFIHKSTATFNILGPIIAFMGFSYFYKEKINLRVFDFYLIGLYIFFYTEYYSILPDLFFRPGFDEDAAVFDMSSSNAIPISLNVTLYAYIICDRFFNNENKKNIFFFSIINLLLIAIQQSRAGIVISLVLLVISMYHYAKKWLILATTIISVIIGYIFIAYGETIKIYLEIIGDLDIKALGQDIRGEAQSEFFKNMTSDEFMFGHGAKQYAGDVEKGITYTFNVFLDMWDKYGITILIVFMSIFAFRCFKQAKFEFPIYYFIPFFMYSSVESIFFPNFWDCIIYLLLFTPKLTNKLQNNKILIE